MREQSWGRDRVALRPACHAWPTRLLSHPPARPPQLWVASAKYSLGDSRSPCWSKKSLLVTDHVLDTSRSRWAVSGSQRLSGLGVPWEMGLPGSGAPSSAPTLGVTLHSHVAELHVGDRGTGLPVPCSPATGHFLCRHAPAQLLPGIDCPSPPSGLRQKGQLWDGSTGPRPGDRESA